MINENFVHRKDYRTDKKFAKDIEDGSSKQDRLIIEFCKQVNDSGIITEGKLSVVTMSNGKIIDKGDYKDKGDALLTILSPSGESISSIVEVEASKNTIAARIKESKVEVCIEEKRSIICGINADETFTNDTRVFVIPYSDMKELQNNGKFECANNYFGGDKAFLKFIMWDFPIAIPVMKSFSGCEYSTVPLLDIKNKNPALVRDMVFSLFNPLGK